MYIAAEVISKGTQSLLAFLTKFRPANLEKNKCWNNYKLGEQFLQLKNRQWCINRKNYNSIMYMPITEGKDIFLVENFHFEPLLNFLNVVKFRYVLFDKGEF